MYDLVVAGGGHEVISGRWVTALERLEALAQRRSRGGSWRRPPVWDHGAVCFLITAACYEPPGVIGGSAARMSGFEMDLLNLLRNGIDAVFAHVLPPNHYHVLVRCGSISKLKRAIGRFRGQCSRTWNLEDASLGRNIFHGSAETRKKSEGHFLATVNFVYHNPIKHGYVERWQDWPWSSASDYLDEVGEAEAKRRWKLYPSNKYGKSRSGD